MTCAEMNDKINFWKEELFLSDWDINWKISMVNSELSDIDDCNDIIPYVEIVGDQIAMVDLQMEFRTTDKLEIYNFDFDYVIVKALLQIINGPFTDYDPPEYDTNNIYAVDRAREIVDTHRIYKSQGYQALQTN